MTSLVARHGWSSPAVPASAGAHAGGVGLAALMGVLRPVRCASGLGSSGPLGLPGYVGCLNSNVAGRSLTVIDWTVMSVPGTVVLVMLFFLSKSRLNSLRHCVERCRRSTCVPGRSRLVLAS